MRETCPTSSSSTALTILLRLNAQFTWGSALVLETCLASYCSLTDAERIVTRHLPPFPSLPPIPHPLLPFHPPMCSNLVLNRMPFTNGIHSLSCSFHIFSPVPFLVALLSSNDSKDISQHWAPHGPQLLLHIAPKCPRRSSIKYSGRHTRAEESRNL